MYKQSVQKIHPEVVQRTCCNHICGCGMQGAIAMCRYCRRPISGLDVKRWSPVGRVTLEPYKKAWSVEETVAEITRQSDKQCDPQVVESFLKLPHQNLA